MDDENLPENMKLMLNNYRIYVLEIRSFQHIDCFSGQRIAGAVIYALFLPWE